MDNSIEIREAILQDKLYNELIKNKTELISRTSPIIIVKTAEKIEFENKCKSIQGLISQIDELIELRID